MEHEHCKLDQCVQVYVIETRLQSIDQMMTRHDDENRKYFDKIECKIDLINNKVSMSDKELSVLKTKATVFVSMISLFFSVAAGLVIRLIVK